MRRGGGEEEVAGRRFVEAGAKEWTQLWALNTRSGSYIRAINKSRKQGLCDNSLF